MELYENDWIEIDGNSIHKTAIIHPNVKLGKGNTIGAYCVIGGNGEIRDKDQKQFKGTVEIGDFNVISEVVTIQRPFVEGDVTRIGNKCLIMAHSHLGHDVKISDNVEICSGSVIGGYVEIGENSKIKLKSVVRNRVKIGKNVVVGMGSVVTKDVIDDSVVYGNPAKGKENDFKEKLLDEICNKPDLCLCKDCRFYGSCMVTDDKGMCARVVRLDKEFESCKDCHMHGDCIAMGLCIGGYDFDEPIEQESFPEVFKVIMFYLFGSVALILLMLYFML